MLCGASGVACAPAAEPPGAVRDRVELPRPHAADGPGASDAAPKGSASAASSAAPIAAAEKTFVAGGFLAAVASETSVYEAPRWGSKRLGYLRLGAVIPREAEPAGRGGRCPDGWYRVAPRGYVCAGALASIDPKDPRVLAAHVRPKLDDLPYPYVMSRSPPPVVYARLPTKHQELRFEPDLADHLADGPGGLGWPAVEAVPTHLEPKAPTLALGNAWRAPESVFLGHARARSGYALLSTFDHLGRRFGLTPELEVLPLDRTKLARASTFQGVELGEHGLPVAFAKRSGALKITVKGDDLATDGAVAPRGAVFLSPAAKEINGREYLVGDDGALYRSEQLVLARVPKHLPAWAAEGLKWIDVSIPRQLLVAWEGTKPVYATLVSTGVGGTGDPEETHATIQGMFRIYEKHITHTMAGREAADPFDLRDVPFVQYFTGGYALHAAYWHDDFGHLHSHGCVNLAPKDAAWLFAWTDPRVPDGWHGTMSNGGTIVFVHD